MAFSAVVRIISSTIGVVVNKAAFRIAVVIPAFNRAHLITDALDSIARQTRLPDEVVVVDDGSQDGTYDIVDNWQKSHSLNLKLIRQANRGVANARNQAIKNATAELIAPLDSDDVWLPNHLQVLELAFQVHPQLILCGGNTERMDDVPYFKRVSYTAELFDEIAYDEDEHGLRVIRGSAYTSLVNGAYVHTSSCMFPKQAAESVGYFDEQLRSFEDNLFFLRLAKKGSVGVYLQSITMIRKHDQNLTHRRNIASHVICSIDVLQRALRDARELELTEDELCATRTVLSHRIAGGANRASKYGVKPYLTVCRELLRRGHWTALLRPKPLLRAIARPHGDRAKLEQKLDS